MLVLSRKLNEKIVIDGGITITVVKIDRNQVRIGIQAPGDVGVYREELLPLVRGFDQDETGVPITADAVTV
jgi:carbon storage regulator